MNYLEEANEKIEAIFLQGRSPEATIRAIEELFRAELVRSFKNGIEVGGQRASQPKAANKGNARRASLTSHNK